MAAESQMHCAYCRREISRTKPQSDPLRATRDHVTPRSKMVHGPNKIVWACSFCNSLKADRAPLQWDRFMKRNPRWWEHPYFTGQPKPARLNRIPKPPPLRETQAFLRAAAMRPLRADEPFPKEYDDPQAQEAFERAYAGRKHFLRVESDPPRITQDTAPRHQPNPDWASLQAEVKAQYPQTLAYLAK